MVLHRFRTSALWRNEELRILDDLQKKVSADILNVVIERRFVIDTAGQLTKSQLSKLNYLLQETFEQDQYGENTRLTDNVFEVGPRLNVVTPASTNAVAICRAAGLNQITRIEQMRRVKLQLAPEATFTTAQQQAVYELLYDRMIEQTYLAPVSSFSVDTEPAPAEMIPIFSKGVEAIKEANEKYGLAINAQMAEYICNYTLAELGRDQTEIEVVSFGQLNSEHCRHPRFNGLFIIDKVNQAQSLFDLIKATTAHNHKYVRVAYKDNAASLWSNDVLGFISHDPATASPYVLAPVKYTVTLKVETHNHPTGIEPFAGAATGTGGEIRDRQMNGRGGIPRIGLACYYVGSLFIPNYDLPWEKIYAPHPTILKTPLEIAIQASNGASDYGNKFGQPIVLGSFTSFEQMVGDEHYGWRKTCMVAGGVGQNRTEHVQKLEPAPGNLIIQLGGDAYWIGYGGGSGSSKDTGVQSAELDFNSVQRADPAMETAVNEVIRACSDLGKNNPIITGTDLGAGGESVALAEIAFPHGAYYELRRIPSGDPTMPKYVLWCNESQERVVIIIQPQNLDLVINICERNRCPVAVVGEITGDGRLLVTDELAGVDASREEKEPINLAMNYLLADLPQMKVQCATVSRELIPLNYSADEDWEVKLEKVLRNPKVASKHWLTNKVDRSVGGLVAQQQTVGAMQLSLADCAVVADGFFNITGTVSAIGERPIIGLVNTEAGGRMSIGEALTNLVWAPIKEFGAISFSATWQWACGQPGEDARLYKTVAAVSNLCLELGLPIPVGKDSLSMTAWTVKDGNKHAIKAPGTVQMIACAPCTDITKVVTPDIKMPGKSKLMLIDLSGGKNRLGGSVLAQVHNQLGDEAPDVEAKLLKRGWLAIQQLVQRGLVLAGHDRSDGGLITCLLEMAFAGNCGWHISLDSIPGKLAEKLFAEELGIVVEYSWDDEYEVHQVLDNYGLGKHVHVLGDTVGVPMCIIQKVRALPMPHYRRIWLETGLALDKLQTKPECAEDYVHAHSLLKTPATKLTFTPQPTPQLQIKKKHKPKVAVLREVGTNGHRELAAAFYAAGFEPWDVTVKDLALGKVDLEQFQGIAIAGGFSYSDVFGAGKGLVAVLTNDEQVKSQWFKFIGRTDTFVLGICNGCQAMSLLGLVPWSGIQIVNQPRFVNNDCGRFVHEFVTLSIMESPAIFLKDMAGSSLGIWVAHGEGRFLSSSEKITKKILSDNLAPLRYVDNEGLPTVDYPYNPNGSPYGIAALTSSDGRFMAMMPHPERLFQLWQWPYWPLNQKVAASPWLKMFQNAKEWCDQN